MEKMRRARINDSLNEMKTLVLDLLNKDVSRFKLNPVSKWKTTLLRFPSSVDSCRLRLHIYHKAIIKLSNTRSNANAYQFFFHLILRLLDIQRWKKLTFWKWQWHISELCNERTFEAKVSFREKYCLLFVHNLGKDATEANVCHLQGVIRKRAKIETLCTWKNWDVSFT